MTRHHYGMWAHSFHVISQGRQWWRREMSAIHLQEVLPFHPSSWGRGEIAALLFFITCCIGHAVKRSFAFQGARKRINNTPVSLKREEIISLFFGTQT